MKPLLPPEALTQHIANVGKTGAGKTNTAKTLVELAVGHAQRVCILDPLKSDWWGLISSASGKAAGLPFTILGGPRQHAPLPASSGAAIGEMIGKGTLPLSIIDMADMTPAEMARWYTAFAESLLRHNSGVLVLVLEEADVFAPKEKFGTEGENMRLHWSSRLARAGRSKGIRLILNCQRTQKLHNDMLGSCETVIAHRLTMPADRDPVLKWFKANVTAEKLKEIDQSLSQLTTGEAWVCYAEGNFLERVKFPRCHTFDNSKTPASNDAAQHVKVAEVDIDALRVKLADAVKEAEANDPKVLKKKIAELERTVAAKERDAGIVDAGRVAQLEAERVGWIAENNRLASRCNELADYGRRFQICVRNVVSALTSDPPVAPPLDAERIADELPPGKRTLPLYQPPAPPQSNGTHHTHVPTSSYRAARNPQAAESLSGPQKKILAALAWWSVSIGDDTPTVGKVGFKAGYAPSGGSFGTYLSQLSTAGLIERNNGTVQLTKEGAAAAEWPDRPGSVEELRACVREVIEAPHWKILSALIEAGRAMSNEELGQATGYIASGGSFGTYLSRLSSLGLVERGRGFVTAASFLS